MNKFNLFKQSDHACLQIIMRCISNNIIPDPIMLQVAVVLTFNIYV